MKLLAVGATCHAKFVSQNPLDLPDIRTYQLSCHWRKRDVLSFFGKNWREMACQNGKLAKTVYSSISFPKASTASILDILL
ncbi:MAG: hypothetical protein MUC59_10520 [Saprospiraceae bacterium]|nr:hypothetical protein [Saprospiraceae bacterium]